MRYNLKHTEPENKAYEDNTPILYFVYDTYLNRRVSSYFQNYNEAQRELKNFENKEFLEKDDNDKSLLEEMFNETCSNLCKWPELIYSQEDLFEHHCKDCILKKYLI